MTPGEIKYCSHYCEENIWHLAEKFSLQTSMVLFISNPQHRVALWQQKMAEEFGQPVIWDYHVILLTRRSDQPWQCWDLDSELSLPCDFLYYLQETFPHQQDISEHLRPHFKLINAQNFRNQLCSDRRHMRRGGQWLSPPPPWPCIGDPSDNHNLDQFIDMSSQSLGSVSNLEQLTKTVLSK